MKKVICLFSTILIVVIAFPLCVFAATKDIYINDLVVRTADWVTNTENSLEFANGGVRIKGNEAIAGNRAEKYLDAKFHFRSKVIVNETNWASFLLRSQMANGQPWHPDNEAYMVAIRPNAIQLYRYNRGKDTYLKGINTEVFAKETTHDVVLSTINTTKGVRIIMSVDKEILLDFEDIETPLKKEGYFCIMGFVGSTNILLPVPGYVTKVKPAESKPETPATDVPVTPNEETGDGMMYLLITIAGISAIMFFLPEKFAGKFRKRTGQ